MGKKSNAKKIIKEQIKTNKEKKEEINKKIKAFFDAYTELCKKTGVQIDAKLHVSKKGIETRPSLSPHYEKEVVTKNKYLFILKHAFNKVFLVAFKQKKFKKDYVEVCKEHRIQLGVITEITDNGINPKINITNYIPKPKGASMKDWKECEVENKKNAELSQKDRQTLSEEEFKKKWPDRPYKVEGGKDDLPKEKQV